MTCNKCGRPDSGISPVGREPKATMDCDLCRNKIPLHWRHVCDSCFQFWELGRKRQKLGKSEGRLGHANVVLELKFDGEDGNPEKPFEIRSKDLIAAMGAMKLRGTSLHKRFSRPDGAINIGMSERHHWMIGGSELVQVPESRAVAMAKIVAAVFNALARARVDGFNDGRNLLAGLANGQITTGQFDAMSEKVADGRRPSG